MNGFTKNDAEKIMRYDALKRAGGLPRGDAILLVFTLLFIALDVWEYTQHKTEQLISNGTMIFVLVAAIAYIARNQRADNQAIVAEIERIKKSQGIE